MVKFESERERERKKERKKERERKRERERVSKKVGVVAVAERKGEGDFSRYCNHHLLQISLSGSGPSEQMTSAVMRAIDFCSLALFKASL